MPATVNQKYPNLPNYAGTHYVFFDTTKVREDSGDVEGVHKTDLENGNNPGAVIDDDNSI